MCLVDGDTCENVVFGQHATENTNIHLSGFGSCLHFNSHNYSQRESNIGPRTVSHGVYAGQLRCCWSYPPRPARWLAFPVAVKQDIASQRRQQWSLMAALLLATCLAGNSIRHRSCVFRRILARAVNYSSLSFSKFSMDYANPWSSIKTRIFVLKRELSASTRSR